jgi:hypothetical protein
MIRVTPHVVVRQLEPATALLARAWAAVKKQLHPLSTRRNTKVTSSAQPRDKHPNPARCEQAGRLSSRVLLLLPTTGSAGI